MADAYMYISLYILQRTIRNKKKNRKKPNSVARGQ